MREDHYYEGDAIGANTSVLSSRFRIVTYMIFQYLVYGAIGWIVETSYIYVVYDHFSRRGLISHGLPMIPLFGYGGLLIVTLLKRWKNKPAIIYFFSVFLATSIEFLTGLSNLYLLNRQTWNYNRIPLSYKGFVALPVSLAWGLLITLIVYILEPALEKAFKKSGPIMAGIIWAISFACIYCHFTDFLTLFIKLIHLN